MRTILALVLVAGCTAPISGVRLKGAEILSCRADALAVEHKGGYDYYAQGCGHSIWLRCLSERDATSCRPAPPPTAVAYDETSIWNGLTRNTPAVITPYRPPAVTASRPTLYMPGQYNPNIGAIQHDYAHQYTRPYTPPPPVYRPPVYTPSYTPSYRR